MSFWWRRKRPPTDGIPVEERIRAKYQRFRELLSFNNECLELMARLQEDLQFVPPRRDLLDQPVAAVFERVEGVLACIEKLVGAEQPVLRASVQAQRNEIERYMAALQELITPRLSAWLHEIGADSSDEAGRKAAVLGEIKSQLGMPVPNGYVLTTEAYRQFCGIPLWTRIRDSVRDLDLEDLEAVRRVSQNLTALAMERPIPRAIEVAITERARTLGTGESGLAIRSSAVGEGGARTYAGQYISLLNIRAPQLLEAYKRVVAGRFSERALFYRLSSGLLEVDSSMAVLFLPVLPAKASGIMYTRDPANPKSKTLWITATRGLGLDIASGRMPADLFILSRNRSHDILERQVVRKEEEIGLAPDGGIVRRPLSSGASEEPSLETGQLGVLATLGMRIEEHFKVPQDIEWVLDDQDKIWIVQARPLALADAAPGRAKSKPKSDPVVWGGRAVYPGRVSGNAFMAEDTKGMDRAPVGAILFIRRPSPEIVKVFPRISGLVAESGNVTGHAAALLREFRIPSVFQMPGAFEKLSVGDPVSLDAVQTRVYKDTLWPARSMDELPVGERYGAVAADPISRRLLALSLLDPARGNFRPSGCKSAHDVLRYCHEKAIEAMFDVGDIAMETEVGCAKELKTSLPLNVLILDLGGGLSMVNPAAKKVLPTEILSRPFRSLWRGISHSQVSWTREMPASFGDLASVLAQSFTPRGDGFRALGEKSYLLVAEEYMNLNSRLAYHFSLVDACLSDAPSKNYISFRFEGGGATPNRRTLRACFIEACLKHYSFQADRRGDLVNAWFRKGSATETGEKLDVLGRLLACSSQLDMYMTSHEVMRWYVRQFLLGNYSFSAGNSEPSANTVTPP